MAQFLPFSGFLTVLAIATLTNGMNIIDGLNGFRLELLH